MVKNIQDFFEKFYKLTPPERYIKEECQKILQDELGISVDIQSITLQKNILYIQGSAYIKNEIAFKKNEILQILKERLKRYNKNIIDIR